jgi:hypothetical protein
MLSIYKTSWMLQNRKSNISFVVYIKIGQEVTGDVLLDLTHDGLKELGITAYGRRYRIINSIDGLRRFVESINSSKANLPSSRRGSIPENQSSVNVVTCFTPTISSKQGNYSK